jgi:prepilin-type N-terminal cleavage/methylation domain-containing protein/prepilin-type processing-associated H-X9-DG protein
MNADYDMTLRHPPISRGFTLIEFLVVVTIISLLAAILFPTLARAREVARSLRCASHLNAVGRSLFFYADHYNESFPATVYYKGLSFSNNMQYPELPTQGYVHFSRLLTRMGFVGDEAFLCPAFDRGGLPPANSTTNNLEAGQVNETSNVIDEQVSRCAFTLNAAVFPASIFREGFNDATRPYRFVRSSRIENMSNTILATEWNTNWQITVPPGSRVSYSHSPIHGFACNGKTKTDDRYEVTTAGISTSCYGALRRIATTELADNPDPNDKGKLFWLRLNRIGRNHGSQTERRNNRQSNFFYADGHVETKSVYKTVEHYEWGDEFYSLVPGNDIYPN